MMVNRKMLKLNLLFAFLLLESACSDMIPGQRQSWHRKPPQSEIGAKADSFDCIAGPGHYSELNTTTAGTNYWVTGSLQILDLRTASAWPPDAGVVFAGTSHWPRIGLETFVLGDKPASLQIAVRGTGGGSDHTVFAAVPVTDSPIRFALRLNSTGQLSLSFGEAVTSLSVGSIAITRMNLYCSSAHVRFSDIQVGSDN